MNLVALIVRAVLLIPWAGVVAAADAALNSVSRARVDTLVRETMENAFPMDVPLKVETKHGRSWGEME